MQTENKFKKNEELNKYLFCLICAALSLNICKLIWLTHFCGIFDGIKWLVVRKSIKFQSKLGHFILKYLIKYFYNNPKVKETIKNLYF